MAEFKFKIDVGSDITVAHRKAVTKAAGAFIDVFKYDEKTGEVFVSTRPLPPFGILERESEQSKFIQQTIADYAKANNVLVTREAAIDKREKGAVVREKKIATDREQLDKERKEFEDEKKGKKKPSLISRVLRR